MCPADTSPEVWKVFLDLQRKMPPSEKLQRTLEWSDMIRKFAEAGMRQRYPNADEAEIRLRFARMTLGQELFQKAFGQALSEHEPTGQHD
jgi:hypothetical protein